jgi:preprotein translocase subunit SecD
MNNKIIRLSTIGLCLLLSIAFVGYGQTREEREDGFYKAIKYLGSIADKNIKWEEYKLLITNDIMKVKKVYSKGNKPEISVVLTKCGAQKFYSLTKENIGKPTVIVIENQVV